jgi:hypothetical protein
MNHDDIERIASDAGLVVIGEGIVVTGEAVVKLCELVAAAEREKYNELLMAVGKKFPDESRHETALRYIREAESKSDCADAVCAREEK